MMGDRYGDLIKTTVYRGQEYAHVECGAGPDDPCPLMKGWFRYWR